MSRQKESWSLVYDLSSSGVKKETINALRGPIGESRIPLKLVDHALTNISKVDVIA